MFKKIDDFAFISYHAIQTIIPLRNKNLLMKKGTSSSLATSEPLMKSLAGCAMKTKMFVICSSES